jgi:hypothetical protein
LSWQQSGKSGLIDIGRRGALLESWNLRDDSAVAIRHGKWLSPLASRSGVSRWSRLTHRKI